jgi:hypothetical protein
MRCLKISRGEQRYHFGTAKNMILDTFLVTVSRCCTDVPYENRLQGTRVPVTDYDRKRTTCGTIIVPKGGSDIFPFVAPTMV